MICHLVWMCVKLILLNFYKSWRMRRSMSEKKTIYQEHLKSLMWIWQDHEIVHKQNIFHQFTMLIYVLKKPSETKSVFSFQNLSFSTDSESVDSRGDLKVWFIYCCQGSKTLPGWGAGPRWYRPKLLHWKLQLHGHQRGGEMGGYHERVRCLSHT